MSNHCKSKLSKISLIVLLTTGVGACSSVDNIMDTKNVIDYKSNESLASLDFPPDLTSPEFDKEFVLPSGGVVSANALASRGSKLKNQNNGSISVLPNSNLAKFGSFGTTRWLDVNASAESLWPKLRNFWRSIGIDLKRDEPKIGIMETDWAQNSAGLPKDWLRSKLGGILGNSYDAGFRDKYRTRIEKTTNKTTRIYVTHKGAEEVVSSAGSGWELRPANHEFEAEILNRLKAFLQGDTGSTKNSLVKKKLERSSSLVSLVTQEGQPILQVHSPYARSWVLTGIMLDRIGLVTEEGNQASGILKVKYQGDDVDPSVKKGFFSGIFGGKKTLLLQGKDYQVHIQDAGKVSVVRIMDEEGKPLDKKLAKPVLVRLKKEFDR